MNAKKSIGILIIGATITLALALLPVIISADDPLTGAYNSSAYNNHLSGDELFKYILSLGLSIVVMIVLKDSKKIFKSIYYPTLIGVVLGILIGLCFPVRVYGWTRGNVFDFNTSAFLVIFGIGAFISLISLGVFLLKK